MHLTVIATDSTTAVPRQQSWVLRLVGTPQRDETAPPDILSIVDKAAARVRATFPKWLWHWVSTNGALELEVFNPSVSWWWHTPLSEKSPLRSRLIRESYWLTLLRVLFETHSIEEVHWVGDDPVFAAVAARLAAQCQVVFRAPTAPTRTQPGLTRALVHRMLYSVFAVFRWGLLKLLFLGVTSRKEFDVALYTRFPILWEREGSAWRERMFGTWPDYLSARGYSAVYAAVFSGSLMTLAREWLALRQRCREQNILILETLVSLFAVLRAHLTLGLFWRYFRWRRKIIKQPVLYDGFDIRPLFWREFDQGLISSEIPFDLTVAAGFRALTNRFPSLRAVFLPFEYQPMERAVWAGTKSVRDVPIVGLQTGLFEANQMGFSFPVEEVKEGRSLDLKSPVPDILAAYGELPYKVFAERLGSDRVCLSGPVRYSHLQNDGSRTAGLGSVEGAAESSIFILVASSIAREESLPLLEGAFKAAADRPEIFFLLKFHYHLQLHSEVEKLAGSYGMDRYRIFDGDLYRLMRLAPITICAGSSIGIEAMTFGSMPVVFRSLGEMSSNPMLEVPDAVFFWNSMTELQVALQSCLDQDGEYQRRRSAWPKAIADQLFDLSASPDARLHQFLSEREIL